MNDKVKTFALERISLDNEPIFTVGKLYDVYRNDDPRNCDRWGFFIIDNNYTKHYFNMRYGKINNATSQLMSCYWEVVNLKDGGKQMETKKGFKVGDKVKVLAPTSAIKDDHGNTFKTGDITVISDLYGDGDLVRIGTMSHSNAINIAKLELANDQVFKDGMVLVCTKENNDYARFTKGNEYPVNTTDYEEPCIFSDGGTAWFDREIDVLKQRGVEFTTKTVLSVPESDPLDDSVRSITVEGKSLGELYTNLRNAARAVKTLESKKANFDNATDDLTNAAIAYKKLGGK